MADSLQGDQSGGSGRKRLIVALIIGVPLALFAWVSISTVVDVLTLRSQLKAASAAVAAKDTQGVHTAVSRANSAASNLATVLTSPPMKAMSVLPIIGPSIADIGHLAAAAASDTNALASIAPAYDASLYVDRTFNLPILGRVLEATGQAKPSFVEATDHLAQVTGTGLFGGRIKSLQDTLMRTNANAVAAATVLPANKDVVLDALGANGRRDYMIPFLNVAQLRAPGGAPLSAVILSFDHGKLSIPFNNYIDHKDVFFHHPVVNFDQVSPPPWKEAGGVAFVNAAVHPDWRYAGEDLMRAWNTAKEPKVTGMIGLDTKAIGALLRATGPITVGEYGKLDADTFAKKVLEEAYQNFADDRQDRRNLNGQVADVVINKMLAGDPKLWAKAAVELSGQIPGRHLQFRFEESKLQKLAEDFDAAGEVFVQAKSDAIGFYSRNRNQSKVDVYSHRSLASTVDLQADGSATVTQILTVDNDSPQQLSSTEKIGYLTAWSANEWFFYLPNGATGATLQTPDGYTTPKVWPDGLGRQVIVSEGTIEPRKSATITYRYQLPAGTFTDEGTLRYRVNLNPQPIQNAAKVSVTVNAPQGRSCSGAGWSGTHWSGILDTAGAPELICQ